MLISFYTSLITEQSLPPFKSAPNYTIINFRYWQKHKNFIQLMSKMSSYLIAQLRHFALVLVMHWVFNYGKRALIAGFFPF